MNWYKKQTINGWYSILNFLYARVDDKATVKMIVWSKLTFYKLGVLSHFSYWISSTSRIVIKLFESVGRNLSKHT